MARFNLPVFKPTATTTPQDLIRLALHAAQRCERQLGELIEFDFGSGIIAAKGMPNFVNQVCDISMVEGWTPERMVEAVDAAFAAHGTFCWNWTFAGGIGDPALIAELKKIERVKKNQDFTPVKAFLMRMEKPQFTDIQTSALADTSIHVIPSRASYPQLEKIWMAFADEHNTGDIPRELLRAQYAEMARAYLDEPTIDSLLVMHGTEAVGTLNLVHAGEVSHIAEIYVHPAHRRQGVGTLLLRHAVELAQRNRARHLTLRCGERNLHAIKLYEKVGFVKIAPIEHLQRTALFNPKHSEPS